MWFPTPRDPGIGRVRQLALEACGADMAKVSISLRYWRHRAGNGDVERWEKLNEQKRINEEVARQERENAGSRTGQDPRFQA